MRTAAASLALVVDWVEARPVGVTAKRASCGPVQDTSWTDEFC